ncbi:Na+/H+ antiporter subunit A, partial [Legionella pneumophila]
ALTFAYSARFLLVGLGDHAPGIPGKKAATVPTPVTRQPVWAVAVPAVLAAAGLVLAPLATRLEPWLAAAGGPCPKTPEPAHLLFVPHPGIPLLLTGVVIVLGVLLVVARRPVAVAQRSMPELVSSERGYR